MPRTFQRMRKRRFCGNRFTNNNGDTQSYCDGEARPVELSVEGIEIEECSSAKKLKNSEDFLTLTRNDCDYYMMINFGMLLSIVSLVGKCPDSNSNVLIKNCLENRKGCWCNILLHCSKWLWKKDWFTSPKAKKSSATPGPSGFDVNVRSVFTFREMGKGYKAVLKFAQYMNMPGAITKTRYQAINDILHDAYQFVTDESVTGAGREAYEQLEANTVVKDCQVSVDGTWQKRGFLPSMV